MSGLKDSLVLFEVVKPVARLGRLYQLLILVFCLIATQSLAQQSTLPTSKNVTLVSAVATSGTGNYLTRFVLGGPVGRTTASSETYSTVVGPQNGPPQTILFSDRFE